MLRTLVLLGLLYGPQVFAAFYLGIEAGGAESVRETLHFVKNGGTRIDLNDADYGKAFEWGSIAGAQISKSIAVELTYNQRSGYEFDRFAVSINGSTSSAPLLYTGDVSNKTYMAVINYSLISIANLEALVFVGNGFSSTKVEALNENLNGNLSSTFSNSKEKSKALQTGVKLSVNILRTIRLGLGYRYINLGSFKGPSLEYDLSSTPETVSEPISGKLKCSEAFVVVHYML